MASLVFYAGVFQWFFSPLPLQIGCVAADGRTPLTHSANGATKGLERRIGATAGVRFRQVGEFVFRQLLFFSYT